MNKKIIKSNDTDSFLETYFKKVEHDKQIKKDLLFDDQYMLWLKDFIEKNGKFRDDDWLYYPDKISQNDKENVDKLHLLFELIEEYAKKNYIVGEKNEIFAGESYYIKFRDICFQIGTMSGQGTFFYCGLSQLNKKDITYIDFDDIRLDITREETSEIENKLLGLSYYIESLSKYVPLEFMEETIDSTLTKIKKDNSNKRNIKKLLDIISLSWSKETCYPSLQDKWIEENPSIGQCAITSLVVNDFLGGKIMRCMVNDVSHYYNFINNDVVDLTIDQFEGSIPKYEAGEERSREYLLSNEDTKNRYITLLNNTKENCLKYNLNEDKLMKIKQYSLEK